MSARTQGELIEQLRTQVILLRRAARAFDEGSEIEALTLATRIRVLAYDNPSSGSHSLLEQLGFKSTMWFLDSKHRPPTPTPGTTLVQSWDAGLAGIMISSTTGLPTYTADVELESEWAFGKVPFDDWWARPIINDTPGNVFTRWDLVGFLVHKDGGAHIDPRLPNAYEALSRSNSLGWFAGPGYVGAGGPSPSDQPMADPVPANVRVIAAELNRSIEEQHGEHLELLPIA